MILKYFINIIINISFAIFTLVTSLFPSSNIDFNTLVSNIISVTSQSTNFLHFLLGDWLFILLPIVTFNLGLKLVVFPIISFIRGFVRFGGS